MQLNTENEDSQHSTIQCEMGVLTRSDGSAIVRQGETIVVAAIHGPTESKMQRMLIEKSNVEAHYRPKSGLPGVSDRLKESVIRNTCETILMATLYPRSTISVVIQEIQDCGELLACAINAACLALLDSGIEMKFLVGAVTCLLDDKHNLTVHPTHLGLEKSQATFTLVFDSIKQCLVASRTTGTFTQDQYHEAIAKSRLASASIFKYYRQLFAQKRGKTSAPEDEHQQATG